MIENDIRWPALNNPEEIRKQAFRETCRNWIIGLLVCTTIALLAYCLWGKVVNGDNLMVGIQNFSTVLSIILSVTSILYAVFTSQDTSRQLSDASSAVQGMREANRNIAANNEQIVRLVFELSKDVAAMKENISYKNSTTNTNMQELFSTNVQKNISEERIPNNNLASESKENINS